MLVKKRGRGKRVLKSGVSLTLGRGSQFQLWCFYKWMAVVLGVLDGGDIVGDGISVNYGTNSHL